MLKKKVAVIIAKHIPLKIQEIVSLLEIPPDSKLGDLSFPTYSLAGKLKKNPSQISQDIVKKLETGKEIEKIEAVGPYVNFFINKEKLAEQIIRINENYGRNKGRKQKIVVEFLSPNTNKPLHIGHLRNMSIGESISRILEFSNNKVIRTNLYNDRGIHICASMLAYKKFGKNKKPNKKSDHFVGDFYILFNKKLKTNKKLEDEARKLLQEWEKGDKQTRQLWEKMNFWVIKGIEQTYKTFGIKFNKQYYESKIYKKGKEIINDGLKKKIFKKRQDNAVIINLGGELGEKVLLRPDQTSVYITQDLYLAKLRYQDYKFNKLIYIVGNEQNYHFNVLFKILKLLGYKFSQNTHHLSYGMVFLPEGRMKSREGKIVDADDLIASMQELAKKELKKRSKLKKKELENRSLKIALSAIKYFLLKVDSNKDMMFNPDKAINFEGDTGPYLQYTYARASSIIKNARKSRKAEKARNKLKIKQLKEQEIKLIKKIDKFPEIITQTTKQLNPSILANYSFQLSQTFNEFYQYCRVVGSEQERFRLALVEAFRKTMKNSLHLLGIEAIEEM